MSAGGGHADAAESRAIVASMAIGLVALAALWLRQGVRTTALVGTVAVALLVGSYLPVWSAGPKSFGSLGTYAAHWEYNSGPAAVVGATVQTGLRWLEVRDPLEIPATLAGSGRPAIRYFDGVPPRGCGGLIGSWDYDWAVWQP